MNKTLKTLSALILFLIIVVSAHAVQTGLGGNLQHEYLDYTRHHDINTSQAAQGANAPDDIETGNARCFGFNNNNEEIFISLEVPSEWNGASNMSLAVHWHAESGDAVANEETVIFDIAWYSVAEGEAVDNGTEATGTATFTGGVSEIDKEIYHTEITIPYTGGNQPLTAGDTLHIKFIRDATTDNYTGQAVVCRWELEYTANKLSTH